MAIEKLDPSGFDRTNAATTRYEKWLVPLLLLVFFLNGAFSISRKSASYDEDFHLRFGVNVLNGDYSRREAIDDSKMPLSALNALPFEIVRWFSENRDQMPTNFYSESSKWPYWFGRMVTMLFGVVLGWYVFRWARELYGPDGGLLALALYSVAPNIIGHGRLITTDLYIACGFFIATYYFWRLLNAPSWRSAAWCGLSLGFAQICKYSAIFLFPIFAVLLLLRFAPDLWRFYEARNYGFIRKALKGALGYGLLAGFLVLLVVNVSYLFEGFGLQLKDYSFRSLLFQGLQGDLGWVPIPLPHSYVDGLDFVRFREQTALGFGNMYLLGELRADTGFPGYFWWVLLFKLPLAVIILLGWGLIRLWLNRSSFSFRARELALLWPLVVLLVYFNYFNNSHIGVRFVLPIIPFVFVLCGAVLWQERSRKVYRTVVALVVYAAISFYSYYPHLISYFNELIWNRMEAYKVLADSNIDWNQNRFLLGDYLRAHPDSIFEPQVPTSGRIVVGVNALTGTWLYHTPKELMAERFRWLRNNFKPVDHIGYSYLVYMVSDEELNRVRASYLRQGCL